jgi:hypothetical protein
MPDTILDYQSVPPPPTRKQRIASALNRISWIILALTILGIGAVLLFMPRKPFDPFAGLIVEGSNIGPMVNVGGFIFALSGAILGNRWSAVSTLLHLAVGVSWPSIGYS